MKRLLFVLSITLLLANQSMAQGTGFQGRKFWIGYDFGFFPDIFHGAEYSYANFTMHHALEFNYAVNMKRSIALGYKFGFTPLSYYYTDYYHSNGYYYEYSGHAKGKLYMHTITFNTKTFNNGYIAPHGRYTKLGLDVMIYNTSLSSTATDTSSHYTPEQPSGVDFAIKVGYGRQFVVAKRMTVDYGFDVGFPLLSYVGITQSNSAKKEIATRIIFDQMIQLHVGLGFLAF